MTPPGPIPPPVFLMVRPSAYEYPDGILRQEPETPAEYFEFLETGSLPLVHNDAFGPDDDGFEL
jgi:hypothetical protein